MLTYPHPHTAHTVYLSAVHICLSDMQLHIVSRTRHHQCHPWQLPDHGATRPLEGVHRRRQRAMTPLPTGSIVQRWLVGCGILVVLSLPACTHAQSVPTGYTRFAQHWIVGRDQAGITAVTATNQLVDNSVAGCAAACNDDRGCNSFEYGIAGDDAGQCRLSYDTRSTVAGVPNAYASTTEWDYYERSTPSNPLVGFATGVANRWIPGVDDIATYTNATQEACAALCLHHSACRSFEWSNAGAPCEDATVSGFSFGSGNTATHATCAQLAATGNCNHALYGFRIRDRCQLSCGTCPPAVDICMLSHYAAGDAYPTGGGGSTLALASQANWTYFQRNTASTPLCSAGTASVTGTTSTPCTACPADTFSSVARTRCIACPVDYVSNASSGSIHDCVRNVSTATNTGGNSTIMFQEGEVWIGNYNCGNGVLRSGNGRLELLVTDVAPNGTVTLIRRFINSHTRGSYYMTASRQPTLGGNITLTPGAWIDQPANVSYLGGQGTIITYRIPLSGTFNVEHGAARFIGSTCDGNFSLTRACEVTPGPATFQVGEQWVGEYQCEDTVEPGRTDVRRLDLTITATNGSHVQVVSKFTHQDVAGYPGYGAFNLTGNFSNSTHRLHLVTPGVNAWIRRPSARWYTSDLSGVVTDDKLVFFGTKGPDLSCGCRGVSTTVTALDRARLALVTRTVGGVCTNVIPEPCEAPWNTVSTLCWNYSPNPWCYTHDTCPNSVVSHVTSTNATLPLIHCAVQQCSSFSAHRICQPLNYTNFCDCTGQTDSAGNGGTCQEYPNDARGPWCYVSSRCLDAGPANATGAEGLYWSGCNPGTPCLMSNWSAWGPCVIASCASQNTLVDGTQIRNRSIVTPPQNGGAACGLTTETRTCQAVCTNPITIAPSAGPTAAPTAPPTRSPTPPPPQNASLDRPPGTGNRWRRQVYYGTEDTLRIEVREACAPIVAGTAHTTIVVYILPTTIEVETSPSNAALILARAAACQLCLPTGVCLRPAGSSLSCTSAAPSCDNVVCGNNGTCHLARSDCTNPTSALTVPTCVCNVPGQSTTALPSSSCAHGIRCAQTATCATGSPHCRPALGSATVASAPCSTTAVPDGATLDSFSNVQACLAAPVAATTTTTTAAPTTAGSAPNTGGSGAAGAGVVSGVAVALVLLLLLLVALLMAYRRRRAGDGDNRDAYQNPLYGHPTTTRPPSSNEPLYAEVVPPSNGMASGDAGYADVTPPLVPRSRDSTLVNDMYMPHMVDEKDEMC